MPLVARGIGSGDLVTCHDHGDPIGTDPCGKTKIVTTKECSPNVFVVGIGVVRDGDKMLAHKRHYDIPLCADHEPPCVTFSPNVHANTKKIARLNDTYVLENDHTITTVTQSTVFANGA